MITGTNERLHTIPNDVKPTRVCLFRSYPCEIKAAKIRNGALSEMRKGNIGNVAYYILKCKRGMKYPLIEMMGGAYLLLCFAYKKFVMNQNLFSDEVLENYLIMLFISTVSIITSHPISASTVNYIRYQQTIWDCEKFLSTELDADTLKRIMKLNYDDHEMLHDILLENNIEAPLLYSDPHRPIAKPHFETCAQTRTITFR